MNEAKRESQLVEQMNIAEKRAAAVLVISKALEERLRGHLREPSPTCTAESPKKAEVLVPSADRMRNIHCMVSAAYETLNDIMQRLEA